MRLPGGRIVPEAALTWRTSTSGGPGGQHANRTASRVELIVRIADLPLEPREVALVYERLANRVTGAGELVTGCSDTRDQHRNKRIAERRMEQLIAEALRTHRHRIPTRPGTGAKLRRRETKQHTANRKRSRRRDWSSDDE